MASAHKYERYKSSARTASHKSNNKYTFGCVVVDRKSNIQHACSNRLSHEHVPSCSLHAEMASIMKHLKTVRKWNQFVTILKWSYRKTNGVLSRVEGKAGSPAVTIYEC